MVGEETAVFEEFANLLGPRHLVLHPLLYSFIELDIYFAYGFLMKSLQKLKATNKPWAVLKSSRRDYEAARPWKAAKMTRQEFEAMILELPGGVIDQLKLIADTERLAEALGLPPGEF